MRKALNILQSTSMSHVVVDADSIYTCTGHPVDGDIANIASWLLTEEFATATGNVSELRGSKGLALKDIVDGLHRFIVTIELPVQARIYLLEQLALIERRLSSGCNERLQLGALVSAFTVVRSMVPAGDAMEE